VHLFRQFSLSLLSLFSTLLVLAGGGEAQLTTPSQMQQSTVLRYESVEPTTTASSALSEHGVAAHESLEISLHAYGRQFDLVLEPNPILTPGAINVWVAGSSHTTEAPTTALYKGAVKGEPGSWVRVSVRDGSLDGMIWTHGEIYFLEPGTRFFAGTGVPPSGTVMYRMSDTTSTWDLGSCALETPSVALNLEGHVHQHNPFNDYSELQSHLKELAVAGDLKQLEIALVADYEYYQDHGANSAADMQSILNQIDGIYQAELGVTFHIAGTVVFTSSADPFSNTLDPIALLQEFSAYRSSTSGIVHTAGLAHLFTDRDIANNVIGIAWVGVLCSNYYGTGLSQDFINENKSLVLLTAHEIGHNFNAPHDNQQGSSCASTPFGHIMNPWVSTSLDLTFSSCSKNQIAPEVAGASCLSSVIGGDPLTPTCSFDLDPASRSHTAAATTNSVGVFTGDTCDWAAQSNSAWITIQAGDSGTSDGTVSYALEANPGPGSRTGTIAIEDQTFRITQAAPCSYTLSRYARTFRAKGGKSSLQVRTSRSCGWEATSQADWITFTSTPSGTGKRTLRYAVAPNTTGSVRVGTMEIAGRVFTVTQNP
jgi:hypothetical protein